mmetsp:Transcript_40188/g.87680  ORF Transcript_40188/g.87680 Transcript_40188/m.87680 type:complete len:984 (-) Transcript_40188:61-3012(-)|eukprot:CAMPEP_0204263710 /NCGR_PEP_ID=MMETSP0468-20130131/8520_1 /ASSEMBLY_ACC=CAM_ASM_000383 /TAXON_ID=2969 /ORGANISM="Oxyrrhis marina" /LENGTH=983 /DNA_ID=CAMNT_0051238503 /DNA_START=54 /DNA_END=3005 /DNA_ORIENTATION=+
MRVTFAAALLLGAEGLRGIKLPDAINELEANTHALHQQVVQDRSDRAAAEAQRVEEEKARIQAAAEAEQRAAREAAAKAARDQERAREAERRAAAAEARAAEQERKAAAEGKKLEEERRAAEEAEKREAAEKAEVEAQVAALAKAQEEEQERKAEESKKAAVHAPPVVDHEGTEWHTGVAIPSPPKESAFRGTILKLAAQSHLNMRTKASKLAEFYAKLEANPLNETADAFSDSDDDGDGKPEQASDPEEDYPTAVKKNTTEWKDMTLYASAGIDAINAERHGVKLRNITDATVQHGWKQIQEGLGFIVCMRGNVNGEMSYLTLQMMTAWDTKGNPEPAVAGATPAAMVLGPAFCNKANLAEGESLELSIEEQAEYPCHPDVTAFIDAAHEKVGGFNLMEVSALPGKRLPASMIQEMGSLPESYDMRDAYPSCALPVQDQGGCGACYAFAAASVAGERLCIYRSQTEAQQQQQQGQAAMGQDEAAQETSTTVGPPFVTLDADIKYRVGRSNPNVDLRPLVSQQGLNNLKHFLAQQVDASPNDINVSAPTGQSGVSLLQQRDVQRHKSLLGMLGLAEKRVGSNSTGETDSDDAASMVLSQQELVSCGSAEREEYATPYCLTGPGGVHITKYTNGCNGATAFNSLYFINQFGLPKKSCIPYVSGGAGDYTQHFDSAAGKVPKCALLEEKQCHQGRALHKLGVPQKCPAGDELCIKQAIYQGGSVFASMAATKGFMDYRRQDPTNPSSPTAFPFDVFTVQPGDYELGGHAVVLYGWGVTPTGVKYWWGRNSWSTKWGLDGLFKIRRGTNEARIEKGVHFSIADPTAPSNNDGDCVKVRSIDPNCEIVNTCERSVRRVKVSYLGTRQKCGSWSSTFGGVYPGEAARKTIEQAVMCRVEEDVEVSQIPEGDSPSTYYYSDLTAQFNGAYNCVLRNTWDKAGRRARCCSGASGSSCITAAPGSTVSAPAKFCEDGCMELGRQVMEKTIQ